MWINVNKNMRITVRPLLFDDYGVLQKTYYFHQVWWRSEEKINMSIFCCFPRSTMIRSKTLMPFTTMSATLTITFLCSEMSKNCFPTPELFPKRQTIHWLVWGHTCLSHTAGEFASSPSFSTRKYLKYLNITVRLLYKIQWKPQPFTICKGLLCYYSANILRISNNPVFSTSSTEEINISTNVTMWGHFEFCRLE